MMIRLCPNCACSVQGQQTKRRDEAQDGVMMVTMIRDDGYQDPRLCMMYSIRPKIPWLARGCGQPLAWDVSERQQTAANVTESSGGEVGTKTLLHARDTLL